MSIITVSEAQTYLGVATGSDVALISGLINFAQASVERYLDNKLSETSITGEILLGNVSGFDEDEIEGLSIEEGLPIVMRTKYSPISTVTIKEDGETVDDDDYDFDADTGIIQFYRAVSTDKNKLTIDYKGGYSTAPDDLKYVVLEVVKKMYQDNGASKGEGQVSNKRIGEFSVSFAKTGGLSDHKSVLNSYRRIYV